MHEILAIIALLVTLIVLIIGYNQKTNVPPPKTTISLAPEVPQELPIYFPRPIYPFPRLAYPIRSFAS